MELTQRLTHGMLEDRDFLIRRDTALTAYRQEHPQRAARLTACLAALTRAGFAEDARNIAYIACTAPEPARAAFFGALGRFSVSGMRTGNGLFIASLLDKVFLPAGAAALAEDGRGPYTTFFHECGHAVDFNTTHGPQHLLDITPGAAFSCGYRRGGQTLQDCIRQDVEDHLARTAAQFAPGDAAGAALLVKSVRRGGSEATLRAAVSSEVRADALAAARRALLEHYTHAVCAGPVNEAASDIFGGMTNNNVRGAGYYHGVDGKLYQFWRRWYWFLPSGIETGAQSRELFAEYFSYCMTRNTPAQASVRANFPRAALMLDALLAEMARRARG